MFDGDYEKLKALVNNLEDGRQGPMEHMRYCEEAARQLADCFTLKASFVPMELKVKELEQKLRESEAGAAVMREALKAWHDYFQSEKPKEEPDWQSGEDFTKAWFQAQEALSTDVGKSILATLTEAHWLLKHCHWQRSEVNREWFERCEALLKKWKEGYV